MSTRAPLSIPNLDMEHPNPNDEILQTDNTHTLERLKGPLAIVISQFCERIAFYGISAVLVSYAIRALHLTAGEAATLLLLWQGVCYCSPLLSSWIADHVLGRFSTILYWTIPYAIGLALLCLSSVSWIINAGIANWLAYVALALVAFGQVQVNVITFGADQFGKSGNTNTASAAAQQSYFNWFFFAINAGALLAFTVVAYLAQEVSLVIGFAIPLAALVFHGIAFLVGKQWYHRQSPSPSQSIMLSALLLLFRVLRAKLSHTDTQTHSQTQTPTPAEPWWRAALALRSPTGSRLYTRSDLRSLVRFVHSLPVQLTFIIFWCLWSQTFSTFVAQSTVLRLNVGGFSIPVSGLNVFNTAAIVVLTPLFDRLLYPWLRRLHVNFSALRRIGTGYAVMTLAVLYAALLEKYRKAEVQQGHVVQQSIGIDAQQQPVMVEAADLSLLIQAPAFILIGVGEILAAVSGTEYSYAALPLSLRSTAIAIFWTTSALGTFLGAAIVGIVTDLGWFAADLNAAHLDYYFFLLAGLGAANLALLLAVARFEPILPNENESDEETAEEESDDEAAAKGVRDALLEDNRRVPLDVIDSSSSSSSVISISGEEGQG